MKSFYGVLILLWMFCSCQSKQERNQLKPLVSIGDSTAIQINWINKKSDSIKIALYHQLNLDSIEPGYIKDRYAVFYFTFKKIPDKELSKIGFIEDSAEFDNVRFKNKISIIQIDSNQTNRCFYVQLTKDKNYRLRGILVDNLLLSSDSIRKIGTVIKKDVPDRER